MAFGRGGRFGALVVLSAIASFGGACSLITPLGDLTSGAPDAGSSSGGFGGDTGASPDDAAGTVPVATDAGDATISDAGADTLPPRLTDASDAAVGPFCATLSPQPLFCDDFDEDVDDAAAFTAPWDQVTQVNGTVVRSGGIALSPPFSMLVTSDSNAPAIDLCGYKTISGAVTPGTFTLAFDLYVVKADTNVSSSDAVLAAIELLGGIGQRWALQLEVSYDADAAVNALDVNFSQNASFLGDASSGYTGHPTGATLPIGAWTRVTMAVSVGGGSDAVSLTFGTVGVAKFSVSPNVFNPTPEILVGGTYAEKSTQGWTVRYDNVTFDVL